jgi:AcrR family transcriptional regulator
MPKSTKSSRRYDSPRRREQAEETRRRILAAALILFEREGYVATSMAAVAKQAGVSLKTVYLAFETKSGLLLALWHLLLRGERDDLAVGEQDWYREVLDEADPRRQLRLNARNSRAVKERAGALMEVIGSAASSDAEIGALWQRIQDQFYENQLAIVKSLDRKGALREELDVAAAADILWTLNHPSLHRLLVGERGWSPERYENWLAGVLCSELLSDS